MHAGGSKASSPALYYFKMHNNSAIIINPRLALREGHGSHIVSVLVSVTTLAASSLLLTVESKVPLSFFGML